MWWARYNINFTAQSVPASKEEGSKLECIQSGLQKRVNNWPIKV